MKNKKALIEEKLSAKKIKKAGKGSAGKKSIVPAGKLQKKIISDKLESLLINLYPELKEKSILKRVKEATKVLTGRLKKNEKKSTKKQAAEIVKNLTSDDSVAALS